MRPLAWCGLLLFFFASVVLAACGAGVDEGGHADGPGEEITWPAEATAVVVASDSGGGLPPPERVPERFAAVPDFVLYGDGTTYRQVGDGFRTARIDQEGVGTVLGWAADAGLLEPGGVDTGEPEVYDVGSIWSDVTANGRTRHTQVYAPGFEDEAGGLSGDQIENRARVEAFRERLFALPTALSEDRFLAMEAPLEGQAWEVLTRPSTAYGELSGAEPVWQIDDPVAVGRCRVFTGADARQVAEDVGSTGEAQIWAVDGQSWVVVARPLLPGSAPPCPGGGG